MTKLMNKFLFIATMFSVQALFAQSGVGVVSPKNNSQVPAEFLIKGSCNKAASIQVSGDILNPGTIPCPSASVFEFKVKVTAISGTKSISLTQVLSPFSVGIRVSYKYVAVTTPPPTIPPVTPPPTIPPTPPPPPAPSAQYEVYKGCEAPATTYSRTVYADPVKGSDTGDGSQAKPFKTVSAAFAAKKILAGDRVIALPGNHGVLYVSKYNNTALETAAKWIWIDGREGAKFSNLDIRDMTKWLITNVEVTKELGTLAAFGGGSKIILADSDLYTTKNTSSWLASDWISNKAASAISTRNTRCVSLLRNKILNVRFGISLSTDYKTVADNRMNILAADNSIKNFSADGIRPNASNILIRNNSIIDSFASAADGDGNHDDAIQGFTAAGGNFDNVVIEGTYVQESTNRSRAFNAPLQGLTVFDGLFTNMVLRRNVVLVTAYHGLTVMGAKGIVIENNTVIGLDSKYHTWISVANGKTADLVTQNITVRNNVATNYLNKAITTNNNFKVVDPINNFVKYDLSKMIFDMHLLSGSPAYGKGAGAY